MSMHSSKSSRKRSALSFDRRDLKNKFENKKIQYFMNIKKIVSIVLLLLALSMARASCNFSDIEPTPPVSGGESGGGSSGFGAVTVGKLPSGFSCSGTTATFGMPMRSRIVRTGMLPAPCSGV